MSTTPAISRAQALRESAISADIIRNLREKLKEAEATKLELAKALYNAVVAKDTVEEELSAARRQRRTVARRQRRRLAKARAVAEDWQDAAYNKATLYEHAEAERSTLAAGMEEREAEIAAMRACSAAEARLVHNLEAENIRQTQRAEAAEARARAAEEQMRKLVRVHRIWGPPDDGDTPFQNMMINLERSYGGK